MAKNKQEDIFEAAIQLFAERGYDGTTIPMIAEKEKLARVLFIAILKIKRHSLTHYLPKVCYSYLKQ